jgi:hypothetical protein
MAPALDADFTDYGGRNINDYMLMHLDGEPEIIGRSTWADWDHRDSRSVVVRPGSGGQTLEFPVGTVLYTSPGTLNYPRLSPGRDRVAVLEHLDPTSDGGRVLLVELDGRARPLSDGWGSLEGLGWRPDGREVWFTAAREGTQSALWGVTRAGKLRLLLRAPGRLVLHDVSGDGRIGAESNFERGSMVASPSAGGAEREIPWNDFSVPVELSADGRKVLFFESGEAARAGPIAYLRGVDGSHPVRLGEGTPLTLSPDGRVALTANGSPPQLTLLPTGPGQAQPVGKTQFSAVMRAAFFPDGSRLVLLASEPGSGPRLYTVALPNGPAIPISPENASLFANSISPDGSRVAAVVGGVPVLLDPAGGEPVPIPGLPTSPPTSTATSACCPTST